MIRNIPEGSDLRDLGRFSIGRILTCTRVCREWYLWIKLGRRSFFFAVGNLTGTWHWWLRRRTWLD